MPSASLQFWHNDRIPRLTEIDGQCAAAAALAPPNPRLLDESLRGYVLLLSAHFQGFCRDLYTEASQIIVSRVRRAALQVLFQAQFSAHRKLDKGNPNLANLKEDFKRFGFQLDFVAADPTNAIRLADLAHLNDWRNVAAHQGTPILGMPPLTLPTVQAWRVSCDGLAVSLDDITIGCGEFSDVPHGRPKLRINRWPREQPSRPFSWAITSRFSIAAIPRLASSNYVGRSAPAG
jgi:hypothetical protein